MAKKIAGYIKLQIGAGAANPSPPVGPALGQRGLNIMEFCKAFNAATENMEKGTPVPVTITAYEDKSFTFVTRKPPVNWYLMREAGIKKGSQTPGRAGAGSVSMEQVRSIAEEKIEDMNASSLDAAVNIVLGSARSMGLSVEK